MNSSPLRVFVLAFSVISLAGCKSVYWDKQWQYEDTQKDLPNVQHLRIVSEPNATLKVDDELKGKTPLTLPLPYSMSTVNLLKNQYEKSFGGSTRILQIERRKEEIPQPSSYMFRFEAPGYNDLIMPVLIPYKTDTLSVELKKAGIINKLECELDVEARREYFAVFDKQRGFIENIIRNHAVGGDVKSKRLPQQIKGQNIYTQTYNFSVSNSIKFDTLVSNLQDQAKRNHFVFGLVSIEAQAKAKFTTNVLDTGIVHIVRGQIRTDVPVRDIKLYFIKRNRSGVPSEECEKISVTQITDIHEDGKYAFQVQLSPDDRFVYVISKYIHITPVYKKVDVFSQTEDEISEKTCAEELGVSVNCLRKEIQ